MTTTVRRTSTAAASALAVVAASTLALTTIAAPVHAEPGDVVLSENFDSGSLPDGFHAVDGDWRVEDGRLVVTAGGIDRLTFGEHRDNFRFEADVRFETVANPARWTGLVLDVAEDGSSPWWQAAMRSNSSAPNGIEFAQRTSGDTWNVPYTASAPTDAGVGQDVHVAIEVQGTTATWFFNGERVLTGQIQRSEEGVLGLTADNATVSYDNITVTEMEPDSPILEEGELPVTVAHRGYSSILPENTLLAEVAAMKTGAEYFEVDVQTTQDDVPVIMHDGTVDRTTDGTGAVGLLLTEYLTGLDAGAWKDEAYAGEPVLTLERMLEAMETNPGTLMLEIKGSETREEVERMIDMIQEAGMEDRVAVESFDLNTVRYAMEYAPEIPRGVLRGAVDADPVAVAESVGATMYNPSASGLTAETVDTLHEAGIAVLPYTINSAAEWARLQEIGVDGIVTDRPGAFIGWKEAQGTAVGNEPAAEPTVEIVGLADDAEVERGESIVVAAARTDAEALTLELDGEAVEEGTSLVARDLALGEHRLTATVTGPGGSATDTLDFSVTVTEDGLRDRLGGWGVTHGQQKQLEKALAAGDFEHLAAVARKHVADRDLLATALEEIEYLGSK
ncbi:glycerophosphodiester phosphodiesterase family protein [Citricoccus sp. GCM10030269]|uniref:glycerophosphodiester phosphodiesterase family protein n=1 Tax=Citricoccus sp. GCM10030269 TaxID=3273388 RepID=UPI00361D0BB3